MRRILSLTLLSLAMPFAQAECGTVRLDGPGQPFSKIPVYDQRKDSKKDSNICYAVAAAQIIDADRFYKGVDLKQLTAPLSIAVNYKNSFDTRFGTLSTGWVDEAITANIGQSVCDRNRLDKFKLGTTLDEIESYRSTVNTFRRLNSVIGQPCGRPYFRDLRNAIAAGLEKNYVTDQAEAFLEKICKDHQFTPQISVPEKYGFPPLEEYERLEEIEKRALAENLTKEEGEALASELRVLRETIDAKRNQHKMTTVQNLIGGEKPVPVAVLFNPNLLRGEEGLRQQHYAVIIGREMNPKTKKCDFIVRNSYGPCKDKKGRRKYPVRCEGGNVWIPAEDLMASTNDLTWIPR